MPKAATPPDVDTVFKAFSDRTRLRILNLLHGSQELCVCDIFEVLGLQQAKVSRHLAYLRRAGLVDTRRDGQWIYYRLSPASGSFHQKMLECISCCMSEVPELQTDRKRLDAIPARCSDGGCC